MIAVQLQSFHYSSRQFRFVIEKNRIRVQSPHMIQEIVQKRQNRFLVIEMKEVMHAVKNEKFPSNTMLLENVLHSLVQSA